MSTSKDSTSEYERHRLEALARYQLLDTPAEHAYDRFTAVVARLFRAPVAGLSLVARSLATRASS